MADKIQHRRDTLANWQEANPILADGEIALIATDSTKPNVYDSKKIGDGIHAFNNLEILGYECLQDTGNNSLFPISQNAITKLFDDLAIAFNGFIEIPTSSVINERCSTLNGIVKYNKTSNHFVYQINDNTYYSHWNSKIYIFWMYLF